MKAKSIFLLISLLLLLLVAFLSFKRTNLRSKAAPGIPTLSFAVTPALLQSGQNFDLIVKVNPNNASFNAFELYFYYDPAKVEFQNGIDPSQNIFTPYQLLRSEINSTTSSITIVGTKIGSPLIGSADIELARVKMRVISGATGTLSYNWDQGTRLGNKIARELLDANLQINSGASGGPDLHIDIPSVVTPPGGVGEVQRGQNLDTQVFLKTGANQVKSLDFILPYDDTRLTFQNIVDLTQNIEINPGSGFNTQFVVKKVDTVAKRVIISLVVPVVNQNPVPVSSPNDILLATIKFVVKQNAPLGNFDLLPDTNSLIFNLQDQNILTCVGGFRLGVVLTPIFTQVPSPTPGPGSTGLNFMLQIPDVRATAISPFDVQIELRDGPTLLQVANTTLVQNGIYYQTETPVNFNISQNKAYTVFVKTRISLARVFSGVTLSQNQTLDCTVSANSACGELITQRDNKLLLSGDSDGFDTASGSYNKIDSADLQAITIYFNQPASGAASVADFNLDFQVNISDLEILGRNYGQNGD